MKHFLKSVLIFSTIPLIGIIVIGFLYNLLSKPNNYRFNNGITELYAGDSHIKCAIIDSMLSNGKNVSENSESMYFTYFKLKKLIEENPNIKTIYLGFGYHSFSTYFDGFIKGEFSPSVSPRYFNILPFKEQVKLLYWNMGNLSLFIKKLVPIGYKQLFNKGKMAVSGGYSNNFYNTVAVDTSMDKRIKLQFYTNGKPNTFSEINLTYFGKIIELCKNNSIHLIIIKTPLHPYYQSKIPVEYVKKYNELIAITKLEFLDFSTVALNDSSFIPDGDHLSVKGAIKLTKGLKSRSIKCTIRSASMK